MVQLRVKWLLLFTQRLMLVSARGWRSANESEILNLYDAGEQIQPSISAKDGAQYDYVEAPLPEGKGLSARSSLDPDADDGFLVEKDFIPTNWNGDNDRGYQVEYLEPLGVVYICKETNFHITFSKHTIMDVNVLDSDEVVPLIGVPEKCGYEVDLEQDVVIIPFGGCYVQHATDYSLQLQFINELGRTQTATISCGLPRRSKTGVSHASGEVVRAPKCNKKAQQVNLEADDTTALNCMYPTEERVTCGQHSMTRSECEDLGCCVDPHTSRCYYPLDECSKDRHFVFAIRHDSASIPIDPTKLVVPGTSCFPMILTEEIAIFKFKVTECGTHAYTVGKTQVYLAEVQTIVQALNLKFGVITRSDPVRFLIECRYSNEKSPHAMESVGYMVKTPSLDLPANIVSDGSYGVQLKIAHDDSYSTYMPTHHQPLRLLLGKPVYLELDLNTDNPDSVLVVNYCVAYPRSAKNAMVMVYEGCTNPNDKMVTIIPIGDVELNRYQRRFVVTAFQFMEQSTNKYLDEEIYFMCSTEVCRPKEKNCEVRCFDGLDILLPKN